MEYFIKAREWFLARATKMPLVIFGTLIIACTFLNFHMALYAIGVASFFVPMEKLTEISARITKELQDKAK